MRVRGLGRLEAVYSKLKGFLFPGPMVLLYHRVTYLHHDPQLLAVTPEHFDAHLQVLKQYYQVMSLLELLKILADGKSPGHVLVITFDDGYSDNVETAFPLLQKYGIPATFYLSSGFVGSSHEQFHDDLDRILFSSSKSITQIRLTIRGSLYVWSMDLEKNNNSVTALRTISNNNSKHNISLRARVYNEIYNLLRESSTSERDAVLEELRYQCGNPGPVRPSHKAMSWDQVRLMCKSNLVDIGGHTVNHPYLSALDINQQQSEILSSKLKIEEEIGKSISSFAYPFGTNQSYTSETVALLKTIGFTNSCSNFRGRIARSTDPFQIPRFVVRDWSGEEFLRQIRIARL